MAQLSNFFDDVSGTIHAGSKHIGIAGLILSNENATTAAYFQLFNSAAADPSNGDVPLISIRVIALAASQVVSFRDFGCLKGSFPLGIGFGWSSTRDTFTAHGTATDVSATVILA